MAEYAARLFFVDLVEGKLWSVNFNGSGLVQLATGLNTPYDTAIDEFHGFVYWTETGKVNRCDFDGGNAVTVSTTGLIQPFGIDINNGTGHLYVVESSSLRLIQIDLSSNRRHAAA